LVPVHHDSKGKHVNIEELRTTILQVLSNPSYLRNAGRMSRLLNSYGGASQAAHLIQQFWLQTDARAKEFISSC
jgi:UDP:flavonoid glycosyltransferase YjiC (YdhE family)